MDAIPLPHDTLILVGDGHKALFLRNQGSPMHVQLAVERVLEQDNPATRDQGTDRPGRTSSRMSIRHSALEETDWHQLGEERFAGELAAILYRMAHADRYSKLVIVAPPKVLGKLRSTLHPEVTGRIAAEVPRELTSHNLPQIERELQGTEPAS